MPASTGSARLASVDVFRGLTMAAMVIVNTPGDWGAVYWPLLHADWHGWTPTDLIFPFFVFIVGVSIVLSRRTSLGALVILRRAVLLFALGVFLALYPRFDVSTVRVMGVLQRLALCYLFAALIYRATADPARKMGSPTPPLLVAGALLAIYWALLAWVPAPAGIAGDLSPSGNLGAWLDRSILGEAHLWRQSKTWDPEGLLSTIPAIATALTGVAAGLVLTSGRADRARVLVIAGAASAAAGLLLDRALPINKNLWTSSYVLLTSGLATLALAALHVLDRQTHARWFRPFVVLGSNALVLFVVSGLLVKTLTLVRIDASGATTSLYHWIFVTIFAPLAAPKVASLLFAVAALLVLYALLELLYRRRWFLRV